VPGSSTVGNGAAMFATIAPSSGSSRNAVGGAWWCALAVAAGAVLRLI
jgi:hypothetical protein